MRFIDALITNCDGFFDIRGSSMVANVCIQDMFHFILATRTGDRFDDRATRDFANHIGGMPITFCNF